MTKSNPKDAPLRHKHTVTAYGLFMLAWSIYEVVTEVAITKLLKLDDTRGSIVTSGLAQERRASILRSLLALEDPDHPAITLINKIGNDARRNTMIHGHVRVSDTDDGIRFVKRDTGQRLTATKADFSATELKDHLFRLNDQVKDLQSLLGVTDSDIAAFSKIGESLASKAATSPQPPSAKRS